MGPGPAFPGSLRANKPPSGLVLAEDSSENRCQTRGPRSLKPRMAFWRGTPSISATANPFSDNLVITGQFFFAVRLPGHHAKQIIGCHGLPEEPSLGKLYSACAQELGLGFRLNSLGYHDQVQGVSHADDVGYHVARCSVGADCIDE